MTKLGMKRTSPQKPLKRSKGLNKMSARAIEEAKLWKQAKLERIAKLRQKFGYVPCEVCGELINDNSELLQADGHHNNGNRRENTMGNCRIVHRICHSLITDKNVKDVRSLL
jgi:hypothetical protein